MNKLMNEIENDRQSPQFLMVKDLYCNKLSPSLAMFFSFLVFKAEKYSKINPGIRQFVGYSNESLQKLYANKWCNVSVRTIAQYLSELKKIGFITIQDENSIHRKIYINYEKIEPERFNISDTNELLQAKEEQIQKLQQQLEELKAQNDELLESLAKTNNTPKVKEEMGQFVKILFDKGYLSDKDKLTNEQKDDYNTTLKSFLWDFKGTDKDLFKTINYICSHSKGKKIKNKFSYLVSSIQQYLNKPELPDSLWDDEDDELY